MQLVRLTSVDSVWIWSGCAVVATNLRKKEITKRKKKKKRKKRIIAGKVVWSRIKTDRRRRGRTKARDTSSRSVQYVLNELPSRTARDIRLDSRVLEVVIDRHQRVSNLAFNRAEWKDNERTKFK